MRETIRRLSPADAESFFALRLQGLRSAPSAFSSSYEEEREMPLATVAERLAPSSDRAVFGAFDGDALVGVIGIDTDRGFKLAHKRWIWGMFVVPSHRGRGIAGRLLKDALAFAAAIPGVRRVNLGVNVANVPARRLYESAGFEVWGIEPGALLVDGELHDEMMMARPIDGSVRGGKR